MSLHAVFIVIEAVAFLFAISVHESAHAWMALRNGDPTAYMLGRVTLNPVKHIDLFGTLIMPALCIFTGFPVIGWAKPTPVNTRNFKHLVRSDILTSVAGPISNFLVAIVSLILLAAIALSSPAGREIVQRQAIGIPSGSASVLVPIAMILHVNMWINVLLAVFNLIPVPPLDGSHVIRHFLPLRALRIYDSAGILALMVLIVFFSNFLNALFDPVFHGMNALLVRIP
jgi:Zn-dependent protease